MIKLQEITFWTDINSSQDFNVIIKPPRTFDISASVLSIVLGGGPVTQTGIMDYIQVYQPDVIVLDDLYLDMFGVWGLNITERLAIFNYIEQGHGLILTGGSLFDMRAGNKSVGPFGHVNRLFLETNPTLQDLRGNYTSSLAAAVGLGLFPFYEEAREHIANEIKKIPAYGPPLAFIVRNAPLISPSCIPFNTSFYVENSSDPFLQGIDGNFSVNLDDKNSSVNGTSIGWQLEYPFLMASNCINKLDTVISSITSILNSVISQAVVNSTESILNDISNYDSLNTTFDLSTQQFTDIMNNVTNSMSELLLSLHKARLSMPTEFTIPLNFTIGNVTIEEEITIPIPVEIQQAVIPATIVAQSADGLAAVLRYEAGNHRAAYFSFKPSLEIGSNGTCAQLMKNALNWTSQAVVTPDSDVIANLRITKTLINQTRIMLGLPTWVDADQNTSDTINKEGNYTFYFDLNESNAIIMYWYGSGAQINATLGLTEATAIMISEENCNVAIINIPETGNWSITIDLDDDGQLLTPLAIEIITISAFSPMAPTLDVILPNPDTDGIIDLNWSDVIGASIYYIYRNTSNIISVSGLSPIASGALSNYQDTITSNGTYYYVIVAGNATGNSTISNCENITVDVSIPHSNHPTNMTYLRDSSHSIGWRLYDDLASGNFAVFLNDSPYSIYDWSNTWTNGTSLAIPIDTSTLGVWNYTIYYNDSLGLFGIPDTVIINITLPIPSVIILSPFNMSIYEEYASITIIANVTDIVPITEVQLYANSTYITNLQYNGSLYLYQWTDTIGFAGINFLRIKAYNNLLQSNEEFVRVNITLYIPPSEQADLYNVTTMNSTGHQQENFTRGEQVIYEATIRGDLGSGTYVVMAHTDDPTLNGYLTYNETVQVSAGIDTLVTFYFDIPVGALVPMGTYKVYLTVWTDWPYNGGICVDYIIETFTVE